MAYLIAGPLVALVGIVAVFFVLRRKSVEKRSMYSARRTQIEHKVRAARQRTLAGRGRSERHAAQPTEVASPFGETQAQPAMTYEAPAYEAPPMSAPSAPSQWTQPPTPAPAPNPWEQTAAPAPSQWDTPSAPAAPPEPAYAPPAPEPFRPAPEPTPMPPSEQVWTPAPEPAVERVAPLEPAAASSSASTSAAGWSVVSTEKEPAVVEEKRGRKKDKAGEAMGDWSLASGDSPGMDSGEPEIKRPSSLMAIAQYAVLVVGLVMVLIGVLVMVANSKVT
jgi:hypothetical protein